MTMMSDSLTVAEPIELVARRRFSRLSVADERALEAERREALVNLPRLREEFYARNPWAVTA